MDMHVKDFDSYRVPDRRPWIILPVLIVIGIGVYLFFFRHGDDSVKPESDAGANENVERASEPVASQQGVLPASGELPSPELPAAGDVAGLMQQADKLAEQGELYEARLKYLAALEKAKSRSVIRDIERKLGDVDIKLVLSPRQMPEKVDYVVKRGDSLARIAKKYGTTVDLIQKNNLLRNPNRINAGDRLRIFTGKFSLLCSKSRHDLLVMMNGEFFKRYQVGTGRFGKTPVGTFVIREKIKEPPWWRPDGSVVPFGNKKENILGTRWMSLKATGQTPNVRGYGIHGTWSPESVGKDSSAGCLRMRNPEVEEVFVYLPVGTPLKIVE